MTFVIPLIAVASCSKAADDRPPITREPPSTLGVRRSTPAARRPASSSGQAESAAEALYWFLTDGEDGCTCQGDLQAFVRTFQLAHDADPEGRGPASAAGGGRLPTDGYLDPATAEALAQYSGHWLAPCYGAWNSRCGAVPGRAASVHAGARGAVVAGPSAGGCWPASLGDPGRHASCDELRAPPSASPSALRSLRDRVTAACGDALAPKLIREWVYDPRGCPSRGRVAACASPTDGGVEDLEWFYEGTVDDVRQRCRVGDRTLVLR